MKNSSIFVVGAVILFSIAANAADKGGNGGDPITQQFAEAAQAAVNFVQGAGNSQGLDLNKIVGLVDSVKLVPTDDTLIDVQGSSRVALNFPETDTIEINRSGWSQIADNKAKMALALHEYLGILGLERGNYRITSKIFGLYDDQCSSNCPDVDLLAPYRDKFNQGVPLKFSDIPNREVLYASSRNINSQGRFSVIYLDGSGMIPRETVSSEILGSDLCNYAGETNGLNDYIRQLRMISAPLSTFNGETVGFTHPADQADVSYVGWNHPNTPTFRDTFRVLGDYIIVKTEMNSQDNPSQFVEISYNFVNKQTDELKCQQ